MNETIRYYNRNAEQYYKDTINADVSGIMTRFLAYLPKGGSIVDVGCGSGRDVRTFCALGFEAIGLDLSEELARIAGEKTDVKIIVADMASWMAEEPVDGLWCCASLMHLDEEGLKRFISNIEHNLKPGGTMFVSVKTGVETGIDESGRYFRNYSKEELLKLLDSASCLVIQECWETEDMLARKQFKWLNVIAVREI